MLLAKLISIVLLQLAVDAPDFQMVSSPVIFWDHWPNPVQVCGCGSRSSFRSTSHARRYVKYLRSETSSLHPIIVVEAIQMPCIVIGVGWVSL